MQLIQLLALASAASALNIVQSNDDGWAELNIRTLYDALAKGKNSVFISAPAQNESGTGSSDAPATILLEEGEFDSIPVGSPAEGYNASMPRFNYVNSFPVTSMRYGIQTLAPEFFDGALPDLAVAGPNVGANSGTTVLVSGTVGATTEAAKEGLPAIAFSGTTGSQTAWNTTPVPEYSLIYAVLSEKVVRAFENSGSEPAAYMTNGTWVNVNFPATNSTACNKVKDFDFVFTRILPASDATSEDITICGNGGRLPDETTVLALPGCYCSVSVGDDVTKIDVSAAEQRVVYKNLKKILTCPPAAAYDDDDDDE